MHSPPTITHNRATRARSWRRRLTDAAAVALLFLPLYVLAVLMDWDDRRHGVTR